MSLIKNVLLAIVGIVILNFLYNLLFTSNANLSSLEEADKPITVPAEDMASSTSSNNYTYSLWFYVDNWNVRYGEEKVLIRRKSTDGTINPEISLGALTNNLKVKIGYYGTTAGTSPEPYECAINNIPLQRWVNVLVSVYGRTVDVYIDGKLVRTCVLPNSAKPIHDAPLLITPSDGSGGPSGFSGWTSNIQYWAQATNPQEAWNIYRRGYGGSIFSNLFNKYRIRIGFWVNGKEKTNFEI